MIVKKPILFFDGKCGLCNRSVNFLIKIDKRNTLLFSPLQGETAKVILKSRFINDLNSMAFYQNGVTYSKSTAVLKSIQTIGGVWSVFYVLNIIPSFIRNFVYNYVSSKRYKLFGKFDVCRVPSENEKAKFLT